MIETQRLYIRPLCFEDAASIFAYAKDLAVAKFTSWNPHQSIEEAKCYIEQANKKYFSTPLDPLGITLKDRPNTVIGTLGIKAASHVYEAELAYALSRSYWRQGIMREACLAVMEKAFNEYNFKRIYATCAQENIASKSLMKSIGMQFEGCMRARSFCKGRFWDVEMYSILNDEWMGI